MLRNKIKSHCCDVTKLLRFTGKVTPVFPDFFFPSKGTKNNQDLILFQSSRHPTLTGNTIREANVSGLNKYARVKCMTVEARSGCLRCFLRGEGFKNQFARRYFGHPPVL